MAEAFPGFRMITEGTFCLWHQLGKGGGGGGGVISYVVIASEGFRLLPAPTQLCEVINIEI